MEWPTDPLWRLVEAFLTVEAHITGSDMGSLLEATEHWDIEIWGWAEENRRQVRSYGVVGRLQEIPGVIVGVASEEGWPHRQTASLGLARKQAREMAQVFACGRGTLCPGIPKCYGGGVQCPYHLRGAHRLEIRPPSV